MSATLSSLSGPWPARLFPLLVYPLLLPWEFFLCREEPDVVFCIIPGR